MLIVRILLLTLALAMPTDALAHSPYQRELARVQLDDGRTLSIRAHFGDGIFSANPVMAVAVTGDGTNYGAPVAIGPTARRARLVARCPTATNCVVDYFGYGIGPDRSYRLNPAALGRPMDLPRDWEWCIDRGDCPVSGFQEAPSPPMSWEALSLSSVSLSAWRLAPLLLAILILGLTGATPRSPLLRFARWISLAIGVLLAVLSLIWVPYGYLVAHPTSLAVDVALVLATATTVTWVNRRRTNPAHR